MSGEIEILIIESLCLDKTIPLDLTIPLNRELIAVTRRVYVRSLVF